MFLRISLLFLLVFGYLVDALPVPSPTHPAPVTRSAVNSNFGHSGNTAIWKDKGKTRSKRWGYGGWGGYGGYGGWGGGWRRPWGGYYGGWGRPWGGYGGWGRPWGGYGGWGGGWGLGLGFGSWGWGKK